MIVVAKVVVLYVKMGPDNERQSVLVKVEFFYFNRPSFKLKGILHYAIFFFRAQFYSLRNCCVT